MMLSKENCKKINFSIEILSFISICAIFFSKGNSDPGNVIFLFVFENLIMLLSFAVFYPLFNTWHSFYVRKESFSSSTFKPKFEFILVKFCTSLVYLAGIFGLSFVFILFLNQLTIELLVAYLKDNSYNFKSIEILAGGGMFFEKEVVGELKALFGQNYFLFFLIFGIKYFIELILNLFSSNDLKSNKSLTFNGFIPIASKIILGPISIFIACIILVILSAIFGSQIWIVFLTLALFRLLFLFLNSKLTHFYNSI